MSRTNVGRVLARFLRAAALLACPFAVQADDISLKVQPGLEMPLSAAHPQAFNTGSVELHALLGLGRYFDLGIGVGFIGLPMASEQPVSRSGTAPTTGVGLVRLSKSSEQPSPRAGTASTFGAGLRLKRPHDELSFLGASPWVEAEALYVHADNLQGAGFATSAGIAFPLDPARGFWLGPFVRYLDVFQSNRTGLDNRDSSTFSVGLTLEIVLIR